VQISSAKTIPRVRLYLLEVVSGLTVSQESNFITDETKLTSIKNVIVALGTFMSKEVAVREKDLYPKVLTFIAVAEKYLPSIATLTISGSLRFKYKYMTASLFSEMVFNTLRISPKQNRQQLIKVIMANIEEEYSKRTKKSSHCIRAVTEELFMPWLDEKCSTYAYSSYARPSVQEFSSKYIRFLSSFIEEILYNN